MSYWFMGTAVVLSVAGAGYSAYSSYEQGQNASRLAQYNAAQQRASDQANLQMGAARALAQREQNQKILSEQTALFAASGVVTNTGSPLEVELKQSALLEKKAVNMDYENALGSRYGESKAVGEEMQGAAAKQAGNLNATGTLLSGAGNAAGSYYKMAG